MCLIVVLSHRRANITTCHSGDKQLRKFLNQGFYEVFCLVSLGLSRTAKGAIPDLTLTTCKKYKMLGINKKLLAVLALAALTAPPKAMAMWPYESIPLWSFAVHVKYQNQCAYNVRYTWPTMGVLSFFGEKPKKICSTRGSERTVNYTLEKEPLTIMWSDKDGFDHKIVIPIREVLNGRDLYGGRLRIQLDGSRVEVILIEPDKSVSNPWRTMWPPKPAVVIFDSLLTETLTN